MCHGKAPKARKRRLFATQLTKVSSPPHAGGRSIHSRPVPAKRVLVTGGCGFISSNFIRHLLLSTPYEVVSLDALTYAGNLDNLAGLQGHERLTMVHGDIRDPATVREVVSSVDVIVNAAAESHVEKSIEEGASEFVTTNVEGTQILLDQIRRDSRRTFHPDLVQRGLRDRRARAHGRRASAQPSEPVCGHEGRWGSPRVLVLRDVRPSRSSSSGPSTTTGRTSTQRRSSRASSRRRFRTSRSRSTATGTRAGTGSTSRTTPRRSRRRSSPTSTSLPAR